jgi:putative sigma-54 modulation protein
MNLNITGHHIEVTPAIREYVTEKISKVTRHFDQVIDVNVILSVEKLVQKAEVNVHVSGKDIFVQAEDANLYAAIDSLTDKLDRQVVKYKEKNGDHHRGEKKNIVIEE